MPTIYKRLQVAIPDDSNILFKDGSHVMAGDLNLNSHQITNVLDPILSTDCTTKLYVDTEAAASLSKITVHADRTDLLDDDHTQYLLISGTRALSGTLDLDGYQIQNVDTPVLAEDIGQKEYADDKVETDLASLETSMEWIDSVLDKDLVTSPVGVIGNRYLIAGTGGDWSTATINDVTEYTVSGWTFRTPTEGSALFVDDENKIYIYDGSNWIRLGSVTTHSNLNSLTTDDHTQYLLVDGTRNVSSHFTVNNISVTGSARNNGSSIVGTNFITDNLTVPGTSTLNDCDTTSLSGTTVTGVTISGANITTYASVSGLNYYLDSDLELLDSNDTECNVTSGNSVILKSPNGIRWRLYIDDDGNLQTTSVDRVFRNQQKVVPSDGVISGHFGQSVAVHGTTAVVGAYQDDDNGTLSGSAYIFVQSGVNWEWVLQQKIVADDGAAGDAFGYSVDIHEDTIVVGAYLNDDTIGDSGSVYVFTRTDGVWSQQQKINHPTPESSDYFGASVAIYENTIIIGCRQDDDDGASSGTAFIFTRTEGVWSEEAKLIGGNVAAADLFGVSVDLYEDTVVVGAYTDDDLGNASGSAYIFTRTGTSWSEQQQLLSPDGYTNDYFGFTVAVHEDIAIIGSYLNDDGLKSGSGSAYIFTRSGNAWSFQQKLNHPIPDVNDYFSYNAIGVHKDTAVIGSLYDDTAAANAGAAFIFTRTQTPTWLFQAELRASDAAAEDWFGYSVAISGNTAVVGAYGDDSPDGSVYVYVRSNNIWTFQQKLTASDAAANDYFGYSVDIDGDTIVVGAYGDDDNAASASGSVYIFTRTGTTWSQQGKVTSSDPAAFDYLGYSVAISGDRIVAGAYGDDYDGKTTAGSAYVFVRSGINWTQEAKLTPSDPADNDLFANSVDISGDTIIIGSYGDDDNGLSGSGSAYVFTRSGSSWTQEAKLIPNDPATSDYFGFSVAISGDTAVVGAHQNDDIYNLSGSAYVFTRSGATWTQQQKLTASDPAAGDNFGYFVNIDGDIAVIGAYQDDDIASEQGSAYIFTRSGTIWTQQAKLTADDPGVNNKFGNSVSVSGNTVIVGSPYSDDSVSDSGSAYIFSLSDYLWTNTQIITASDGRISNSFGSSVAIDSNTIIIGSFRDSNILLRSGSAYLMRR